MSGSVLARPEALTLAPARAVATLGRLMVVAPHPDDESLGCGGLIALARRAGLAVRVVFMTDGTRSHPNSRSFPPPRLKAVREAEARAALAVLGVAADAALFLQWPDGGGLPEPDSPEFPAAVARCRAVLDACAPQTVVLPWRRDPHPDHRASTDLMRAALDGSAPQPRVLEYPIWSWEQGGAPAVEEVAAWRLDVASVLALKRMAIDAHRSQVSDLITDDPTGFRLTAATRAYFEQPFELYIEDRS